VTEYLLQLHHISIPDGVVRTIYPVKSPPAITGHTIPPALVNASLVHLPSLSEPDDPMKGTLFLFGGFCPPSAIQDTLWVFDLGGDRAAGWRRMDFGQNGVQAFKPAARSGHSCVVWTKEYIDRKDGLRKKKRRILLFGGTSGGDISTARRDDLWVLDIGWWRALW
jgi:hypothetical protein